MLNPNVFIGEPLDFKGKLKIYPPSVKDVITNPNFGQYAKILTITQDDLKDELKTDTLPTHMEFILVSCYQHVGVAKMVANAFEFFCRTTVSFDYDNKRILFGNTGEVWIAEEELFEFSNLVRVSMGEKPINPPEPEDPNEDPRIRRIKEKARQRDRIKAKQSGKNGISLSTCLVAICCMGIGITPLNIGEMSYASVGEIMKMMQDKEKYDIDIKSLLAGADSKKIKPKYWIRNNNE